MTGPSVDTMKRRNRELDLAKGGLVLIMVLYHCASVSDSGQLDLVRQKIHFIHSAFLIISGFLCGIHYHPLAMISPSDVRKKLLRRGFKLIAIFLVATGVFHALGLSHGPRTLAEISSDAGLFMRHFVLTMDGRYVAFEILWYIAVFMLICVPFIALPRVLPVFLIVLVVLPQLVAGLTAEFIAFGAVGMLAGVLAHRGWFTVWTSISRRFWMLFPLLVIVNLVWFAPTRWPGGPVSGVLLRSIESLAWFYTFAFVLSRVSRPAGLPDAVVLLGKYTLFAYLLQMPCARLVRMVLVRAGLSGFTYYLVAVGLVGVGTWLLVKIANSGRSSYAWFDRVYRVCFAV
jgi:hypothetical protein